MLRSDGASKWSCTAGQLGWEGGACAVVIGNLMWRCFAASGDVLQDNSVGNEGRASFWLGVPRGDVLQHSRVGKAGRGWF